MTVKAKVGKPPKASEKEKLAEEKSVRKAAPEKKPEAKATKPKAESKPKTAKTLNGPGIRVTQTGSPIGRRRDQEATLRGLGLGKRHRVRVLEDTPAIRGMINKVQHLISVETA